MLFRSELAKKWLRIYNSAEHLSAGFTVLETISVTQLQKHPNPELYGLLSDTLDYLNELHNNPKSIVIWFFCRFAEIMGFELSLEEIESGDNIVYSVLIENGTISLPAHSADNRVFRINAKLMNKFATINYADISSVSILELSDNDISTLYNFFGTYFSYHFNYNFVLKSGNLF